MERKLTIYRGLLDAKNESNEDWIKKYANQLFKKRAGNWYFVSKYKNQKAIKLKITISLLTINDELWEQIKEIFVCSFQNIKKISPEPVWCHKDQIDRAIGGIQSICFQFYHRKNPFSIFDFIARLFIRLLMGHYLTNGNKRLATAFLYELLWSLGYMFHWTTKGWLKFKKNENKITYFARKAESRKEMFIIPEIKKWIKKNIFIKLWFLANRGW